MAKAMIVKANVPNGDCLSVYKERAERERRKQQCVVQAAKAMNEENTDRTRELKHGRADEMMASTAEWLKQQGRLRPDKERSWNSENLMNVVPPELVGMTERVADEETIPLMNGDMKYWVEQFSQDEFHAAVQTWLPVCCREWREVQESTVVFHYLLRPFNVTYVEPTNTPVVAKVMTLALSLLAARQVGKMQMQTATGGVPDKASGMLAARMKHRDELNAALLEKQKAEHERMAAEGGGAAGGAFATAGGVAGASA